MGCCSRLVDYVRAVDVWAGYSDNESVWLSMSGEEWVINSDMKLENALEAIRASYNEHKHITIKTKTGKQRTNLQNAALHKYCDMLASSLNESGFDMHMVLSSDVEVPWNKDLVKELIWRPVQKAQTQESSTTKAERADYSKVYDTINRYISGRFGVHVPWPEKKDKD